MVEIRNWKHCERLSCVASEAMEQGQVVKLGAAADGRTLSAAKADAVTDADVQGVFIAYWINPRDTATMFSDGADGLGFSTLTPNTDLDANHYIPSGARMLAIGGGAVVRFYKSSLAAGLQSTLPVVGAVLGVAATSSKLCAAADADVITSFTKAGRVIEADSVSVTVLLA